MVSALRGLGISFTGSWRRSCCCPGLRVLQVQPRSSAGSVCPPHRGFASSPPPPRPSSTSGAVGWGSVCFLLFAKGSHSLSSAVFIIGLGKHLPQPPTVPEGCQVTHYTVHPLLPLVPSRLQPGALSAAPRAWHWLALPRADWGCGARGLRGQLVLPSCREEGAEPREHEGTPPAPRGMN